MKWFKTKTTILAVSTALMLPAVAGAAANSGTSSTTPALKPIPLIFKFTIPQTKINGTSVPGIYVTTKDTLVAYIPGGVGLVAVDKGTALPPGAYYVK